ncbi:MAG: hypothetical protein CSB44_07950 [Gammaproteobacteria bacterium]|nr:MAG: hypothetical protein CSB44_07950 [Gammaproteobacteria bacterium]
MKILVDIGNSRCKSAFEDDSGIHPLQAFAWHDVFLHEVLEETWLDALGSRRPESVMVSNVAGDRLLPNMAAWCCQHFDFRPVAIRSAAEFKGMKNAYRVPDTFGVDRWAAMAGARAQFDGALCVIDSGTATTVDVIDADGQHIGGAILPGIYTMRRSLGRYTAALFAADGIIEPFSRNTASGVAGGTGYASVGAIDRLVEEAVAAVGPLTTVITGGESRILENLMRADVVRDPLLVLRGVSEISAEISAERLAELKSCQDNTYGVA